MKKIARGTGPLLLHALTVSPDLRIAVLAPHPDDFDAVAITLRYFRDNGNRIDVAVLTSGASGVEDGFGGVGTAARKGALREEEQRASCRFFGLPDERLMFLRLVEDEEGHLVPDDRNLEQVRKFLLDVRPDFVFLPHGNDTNADHQRVFAFLRQVVREEKLTLTAFLNRDPKTISMRPDLYDVFDEAAALWKGELLRRHRSQHQRNLNTRGIGFDARILDVNRQIAREQGGGWSYAECFEIRDESDL